VGIFVPVEVHIDRRREGIVLGKFRGMKFVDYVAQILDEIRGINSEAVHSAKPYMQEYQPLLNKCYLGYTMTDEFHWNGCRTNSSCRRVLHSGIDVVSSLAITALSVALKRAIMR